MSSIQDYLDRIDAYQKQIDAIREDISKMESQKVTMSDHGKSFSLNSTDISDYQLLEDIKWQGELLSEGLIKREAISEGVMHSKQECEKTQTRIEAAIEEAYNRIETLEEKIQYCWDKIAELQEENDGK